VYYDDGTLVWEKHKEYEVIFEDDEGYFFIINGKNYMIGKDSQNKKYVVANIERETE
jgi:hypothetical protein